MKYWIYAFMLVAQTAVAQVTPGEGNDGPHGGFAYAYSTERLDRAVEALSARLSEIPDALLQRHGVERTHLVQAIRPGALVSRPRRMVERSERPLELDYIRRPNCQIIVLMPFYLVYDARRAEPADALEREIQGKLLHEAAHCSDLGEDAARVFAQEVVSTLYPPAQPTGWRRLRSGLYGDDRYCPVRLELGRDTLEVTSECPSRARPRARRESFRPECHENTCEGFVLLDGVPTETYFKWEITSDTTFVQELSMVGGHRRPVRSEFRLQVPEIPHL